MKKVLFIGVTKFDFQKSLPLHLEKKYLGLSKEIKPYVLGKGKLSHKEIWNTEFFLLPPNIFFWPLAFLVAIYLILVKRVDAIISQSPLIEGFTGVILKKLFKKELIVEIHGDWQEGPFLSKKRRFEALQRKFVPILAKISFRNADKIRGVAQYFIDEAKKIAPSKRYFLFPTFTDLEIFFNEVDINFYNFILFVGRFSPIKGIEILIKAFSEIEKEFPEFKLILVGEGLEGESLESRIKNVGLENRIELKGKLSLEETKNIMKNCYCLVLPSLSEGLPRVLIEAQALGKPTIGSNVGGIPELIRDKQNGFLFEVGNAENLKEKLTILLRDKKLAVEMGKKGKEFVKEKFSNEKYISSYLEMINSPC